MQKRPSNTPLNRGNKVEESNDKSNTLQPATDEVLKTRKIVNLSDLRKKNNTNGESTKVVFDMTPKTVGKDWAPVSNSLNLTKIGNSGNNLDFFKKGKQTTSESSLFKNSTPSTSLFGNIKKDTENGSEVNKDAEKPKDETVSKTSGLFANLAKINSKKGLFGELNKKSNEDTKEAKKPVTNLFAGAPPTGGLFDNLTNTSSKLFENKNGKYFL